MFVELFLCVFEFRVEFRGVLFLVIVLFFGIKMKLFGFLESLLEFGLVFLVFE